MTAGIGALAPGTAQDVDMGAAARALKEAADKDFISFKKYAANRA